MTAHRVGDTPLTPDVFSLPSGTPVEGVTVTGSVTSPLGAAVTLSAPSFTLDAEDESVSVSYGTVSPFGMAGLYLLTLTLANDVGSVRLPPYPVVSEQEDGWHTLTSIRAQWRDAPTDDALCWELLNVAKIQCIAFAPSLRPASTGVSPTYGYGGGGYGDAGAISVPLNYRKAQALQARNIWNVSQVAPSGTMGDEGYVITPRPLDWHVKQELRPASAVPMTDKAQNLPPYYWQWRAITIDGRQFSEITPTAGYVYTQSTPAAVWVIPNTLGRLPVVQLYLQNGDQVTANIVATTSQVTVTFAAPFAGYAVIS